MATHERRYQPTLEAGHRGAWSAVRPAQGARPPSRASWEVAPS